MNVESGIQFDLVGALRRRGKLIVLITGGVFLLGYWVAMALPNQYQASATIFVEPQAISEDLVRAGVGESDLAQRLGLMSAQILSRPRLSRVIDELDLYEEESESLLREEVIGLMRSRIHIEPVIPDLGADKRLRDGPQINTFIIRFTADSPNMAAAVAQRLANDFIREHIEDRVQVTQKSLEFIDAEQQRLARQIRDMEASIAKIKSENFGSLPEDLSSNYRVLERATAELREARRELDVAQGDVDFWQNQKLAAASAGGGSEDVSPARRLQTLELAMTDYEARGFTEKHPDVIKAKQEMEALERALAEAPEDGQSVSLAQQGAEASRRRAEARVRAAEQEIQRLQAQVEQVAGRIEATPRVAEQLDALTREHHQLLGNFNDYTNRRQQANVQVDLERRQLGEQFRILEPAYPPPSPSAPNRPLILVLGLLMGVGFGFAAAIFAEGSDRSYHQPRDVQSSLGVPVLAAIPQVWLEPDRIAARRRLVRTVASCAAVTLFALVGGALTYMYVNGAPGFVKAVMGTEEASPPAVSASGNAEGRL